MSAQFRKSLPSLRDLHGRGPGPLVFGVVAFALLLYGARDLCARLPALRIWPGDHQTGVMFVDAGENTFDVHGDLERADLLIVGDSRVSTAIVPPRFKEAGLGHVAFIWSGAARLGALVKLAEDYPELPIVIALGPLSFAPEVNPIVAELNRQRYPALDVNSDPQLVAAWAPQEIEYLLAEGLDPVGAKRVVDRAVGVHRRLHHALNDRTAEIDAQLGRWLDVKRCEILTPISPARFRREWVDAPNPSASTVQFSWALRESLREEREGEARKVFARLADLPSRRRIALVRLPISKSLRAVEDQSVGEGWLEGWIEKSGRPFKDFGAEGYETQDGSHLTWPAAERASRELARWLVDDLGW